MSFSDQIRYEDAMSVTPGNTALNCDGFRVGTAGDVEVVTRYGDTVVVPDVAAGEIVPLFCKKIKSTNTTATGITALWADRRPVALQ